MSAKFFLDTNIFVYSFDTTCQAKQIKAKELIQEALSTNMGVISYQVIQEFLNVASKKFAVALKTTDLRMYFDEILSPLCDIYPSLDFYIFALEIKSQTGFSFYDSLIVATAIKSGCRKLYTEDMQDQRTIMGLKIINPFR
jgi:predicted nucleic acid-binding protein